MDMDCTVLKRYGAKIEPDLNRKDDIMTPQARREEIVKILQEADSPVTGESWPIPGVSQDCAGYRPFESRPGHPGHSPGLPCSAVPCPSTGAHLQWSITTGRLGKELYQIVDCGGRVVDVIVEHPIYGEITGLLMLSSRREMAEFVKKIEESGPAAGSDGRVHLHTVSSQPGM